MKLNRMIDHIILKPEAAETAVQKIIDEAKEYNFFSACIDPCWVTFASGQLADTDVAVYTVIGFPLGTDTPEVKAYEAADATKNGANEVDMVIDVSTLKSQQYSYIRQDIQDAIDTAKGKALVKMIIETALLTDEEKVKVCKLAREIGADFVKASTGFSTGDTKAADIRLVHETVGPGIGIKVSGCVHSTEEALTMIEAEATRIGANTGVTIVSGATGEGY